VAQSHGHDVRLIPPIYVKPFVKRQKNDAADAMAISEAVLRPNIHFVGVRRSPACTSTTLMSLVAGSKNWLRAFG
jgi:transposase